MLKHIAITLILFVSCQTPKMSEDIEVLKGQICKSMGGKGRIIIAGRKQVFSFLSMYQFEELKYDVNFTFPIYGTEDVSVEYIKEQDYPFEINSSFEQRLLREKDAPDPALISNFLEIWAQYFEELLLIDQLVDKNFDKSFKWSVRNSELVASMEDENYFARIEFKYPSSSGYFERMDIMVRDVKSKKEIILQLIVRKCMEKQTETLN